MEVYDRVAYVTYVLVEGRELMRSISMRAKRGTRVSGTGAAVAAAAFAVLAVMAPAAFAGKPTGKFAPFSDCPVTAANVVTCLYSETTKGEVKLGKTAVPIEAPKKIILQGGVAENPETGASSFVGAVDGNTLVKTSLPVPGGLLDFVNCKEISNIIERIACELVFENGVTGVNATTELAAPASSIGIHEGKLISGNGAALILPIKVKLENPFLGSECYIGSNAEPIVLNLTTGKTKPPAGFTPITGSPGTFTYEDESQYAIDHGVSLVENDFAVPGASGCGGILFSWLLDPIINAKVGIPATAGNSTAILKDPLQLASAEAVKASE
jgi:hypothetical protein